MILVKHNNKAVVLRGKDTKGCVQIFQMVIYPVIIALMFSLVLYSLVPMSSFAGEAPGPELSLEY